MLYLQANFKQVIRENHYKSSPQLNPIYNEEKIFKSKSFGNC